MQIVVRNSWHNKVIRLSEILSVIRPITHHVRGGWESPVDEGLVGQPLDGAVLIVPEAVVVPWVQVPGEGAVCHLHHQFPVHPWWHNKSNYNMNIA